MRQIDELTRKLVAFRDSRDWQQFHTIKNLSAALTVEAAELLEISQWKSNEQINQEITSTELKDRIGEECADIFIYLLLICEQAGIDLLSAANAKVAKNDKKYPVEKARGTAKKYDEL